MSEKVRPESVDSVRMHALRGAGMFADVSRRFPANFVSQGAVIALRCKEKEWDPKEIGDALHADHGLLLHLARLADIAHHERGPGYEMTTGRVAKAVRDDFLLASRVMHLDEEDVRIMFARGMAIKFLSQGVRLMEQPVTHEVISEIANTNILAKF